jgi:hypothetical protein
MLSSLNFISSQFSRSHLYTENMIHGDGKHLMDFWCLTTQDCRVKASSTDARTVADIVEVVTIKRQNPISVVKIKLSEQHK